MASVSSAIEKSTMCLYCVHKSTHKLRSKNVDLNTVINHYFAKSNGMTK